MTVLAFSRNLPGIDRDTQIEPFRAEEAAAAWNLYTAGVIREWYYRADGPGAVLVLEAASADAAREQLATLPFAERGLITFDIVPLRPFDGLESLFAPEWQTN